MATRARCTDHSRFGRTDVAATDTVGLVEAFETGVCSILTNALICVRALVGISTVIHVQGRTGRRIGTAAR